MKKMLRKKDKNKDKYKLLVSDISYSELTENNNNNMNNLKQSETRPANAITNTTTTTNTTTNEKIKIKSLNISVDKECYSCLCDVNKNTKYVICMCCKKILHEKCYDDWIKKRPKMKSICSHCQQEGVLVKYTNPSNKTKKLKRCLGCTEFIQL